MSHRIQCMTVTVGLCAGLFLGRGQWLSEVLSSPWGFLATREETRKSLCPLSLEHNPHKTAACFSFWVIAPSISEFHSVWTLWQISRISWLSSFTKLFSSSPSICLYLKQPREDIKLKHRDVVVAGEIDGWFQGHGFHPFLEGVHALQLLFKLAPVHYAPVRTQKQHEAKPQCKENTQVKLKSKFEYNKKPLFPKLFTLTWCQTNASRSHRPLSWSPCRRPPGNPRRGTWPSAPREYDWTAGTAWSSSSWDGRKKKNNEHTRNVVKLQN